jgi:hypothetical protein
MYIGSYLEMQVIVVAPGPAESALSYNAMDIAQTIDKPRTQITFRGLYTRRLSKQVGYNWLYQSIRAQN